MDWWPYLSLFAIAFAAATLLPVQSELALGILLAAGEQDALLLILAATTGNVLGSIVNWTIGRFLHHHRDKRWFPVPRPAMERAERFYRRWGIWTLFLSWVPVVGDPLTLIAGFLRTPLPLFVAIVTLAKAGRYIFLAFLVGGLPGV